MRCWDGWVGWNASYLLKVLYWLQRETTHDKGAIHPTTPHIIISSSTSLVQGLVLVVGVMIRSRSVDKYKVVAVALVEGGGVVV